MGNGRNQKDGRESLQRKTKVFPNWNSTTSNLGIRNLEKSLVGHGKRVSKGELSEWSNIRGLKFCKIGSYNSLKSVLFMVTRQGT